jgi:uncharacterized membrane protein
MSQLLDPTWWFSFAGEVWPWWLACVGLGILAWPLTVRVFSALTDAGAGLSSGIGIIATTWMAWVLAHPYSGKSLAFRALYTLAGLALLALYIRRRPAAPNQYSLAIAGGLVAFLGLVHLPHGAPSIAFCALVVGGLSTAAVWSEPDRAREELRRSLVPFVVAQSIFAAGFLFFVNVRTYIPWATFDLALWQAEKAGNLMHLNNAMRAISMPPGDAWFLGEPENYYYGGHVMVASLAKLTGAPARIAFNLGLATIFGLAVSMGFSLAYSMAVPSIPPARRRSLWHRGLAWGVLGGLAIAVFGNLDAWRQLGKRDPNGARQVAEISMAQQAERSHELKTVLALRAQAEALARQSVEEVRWSPENLKTIDFWASSRAIHGAPATEKDAMTITEFPYFTALLGDLHPNHTSMPFTIAALAACLALLRLMLATPATSEADWLTRGASPLLAMGLLIGAVLPVSTWDSIVLSVLYLLTVARSRRGLVADERWRWVLYAALAAGLSWGAALAINFVARVPTFGVPALYLFALGAAVPAPFAPGPMRSRFLVDRPWHVFLLPGLLLAALGGLVAGLRADAGLSFALLAALRDAAVLGSAISGAEWIALRKRDAESTWWTSTMATTAAVGALGIVVALPFLLNFHSPLSGHLLERPLPPIPSASIVSGPGSFIDRVWAASPINPFQKELRSELLDEMAHWGLFAIPLAAYLLVLLVRAALKRPRSTIAWMLAAAALCASTLAALDGYWAGAIGLTLSALALWLATRPRTPNDDVPVLIFAATGFFWFWFVEALHFDDAYGGMLERYNTPFKIFCPVWPMLAVATVAALRRLSPPIRVSSLPGWAVLKSLGFLMSAVLVVLVGYFGLGWQKGLLPVGMALAGAFTVATVAHLVHQAVAWIQKPRAQPELAAPAATVAVPPALPVADEADAAAALAPQGPQPAKAALRPGAFTEAPALAPALLLCALGLLYPFAATATRTRSFFSEPIEGTYMDDPHGERTREFYTRRTLDALAWYGQTKRFADDLPVIDWMIANARAGAIVLESPGEGAYTPEGRVSSMTGIPTLVGWKHHENQWRGWDDPAPAYLVERYFDDLTDKLPALNFTVPLSREAELALYRASLEGRGPLLERLAKTIPGADARVLGTYANAVVEARQKALTGYAFIERLNERMGDIYRAPELNARVWEWIRLYRIRYVFVGTLEHEHFAATLGKFDAFPKRYTNAGSTIYEIPETTPR